MKKFARICSMLTFAVATVATTVLAAETPKAVAEPPTS